MKLPMSLMLSYVRSDTPYLPTFCIHPKDVRLFLFVDHTISIYYIGQTLLKVSIICSRIVITKVVFLGVRFCISHKSQRSFCFWNIFFPFLLSSFLQPYLYWYPCWFPVFWVFSPSSKMQSTSKSITVPTVCIHVIASFLIALVSFVHSLSHATLIHLLLDFTIEHATLILALTKTSRSDFKPRPPTSLYR